MRWIYVSMKARFWSIQYWSDLTFHLLLPSLANVVMMGKMVCVSLSKLQKSRRFDAANLAPTRRWSPLTSSFTTPDGTDLALRGELPQAALICSLLRVCLLTVLIERLWSYFCVGHCLFGLAVCTVLASVAVCRQPSPDHSLPHLAIPTSTSHLAHDTRLLPELSLIHWLLKLFLPYTTLLFLGCVPNRNY